jgi:hypothetical protein
MTTDLIAPGGGITGLVLSEKAHTGAAGVRMDPAIAAAIKFYTHRSRTWPTTGNFAAIYDNTWTI